jgi:hypothetical protein
MRRQTSARTKICGLDTKSVGWWKIRRSPTVVCHFDGPLANANFTSDREILNCRAIREGVTPALKAARTAFNFPIVTVGGVSLIRCWREGSSDTESFCRVALELAASVQPSVNAEPLAIANEQEEEAADYRQVLIEVQFLDAPHIDVSELPIAV